MASRTYAVSVTTSWAPLADERCKSVSIRNKTGADLLVCMTGDTADSTKHLTIADGDSIGLGVEVVAAEVSIKAAAGASGVQVVTD